MAADTHEKGGIYDREGSTVIIWIQAKQNRFWTAECRTRNFQFRSFPITSAAHCSLLDIQYSNFPVGVSDFGSKAFSAAFSGLPEAHPQY
jgi:hypothetical protein